MKHTTRLSVLIAALLACSSLLAFPAVAAVPQWQPPGGPVSLGLDGPVGRFAFDPADPAHPYVSIQAGGVFQWRRGDWQKVGADDVFFESTVNGPLAFDAGRGILYAGTSTRGIYRLRLE